LLKSETGLAKFKYPQSTELLILNAAGEGSRQTYGLGSILTDNISKKHHVTTDVKSEPEKAPLFSVRVPAAGPL